MTKQVVILGSLDTKGAEIDFIRHVIQSEGGKSLVVDTGVLGKPTIAANVTREQVADAAGSSLGGLIRAGDKARALIVMAEGAAVIMQRLLRNGQLGGIISIGGSRGTLLGTRAMQSLPVGVPKLMVSTMASGQTPFGPFVGTKDITMMHSVADIMGVNTITRAVLTNAAAAIVAMSRLAEPVGRGDKPLLGATMLGASTPLLERIRSLVETAGFELIAFHANGTGGRAMEEMIESGLIDGVFDVSPAEVIGWMVDGPFSAGPNRMRAAGLAGIPQVIAPCGLEFIIEGPPEILPAKYQDRQTMRHTPAITLVRTSPQEMIRVAQLLAERLAESTGPAAVILPLEGFSQFSVSGQPLHDPQADRAFIKALKASAPAHVQVIELDTHLNDPKIADVAVRLMRKMLQQEADTAVQVDVQLFSTLRDCLPPGSERGRVTVDLPNGATLTELVAHLGLDRRLGAEADEFTAQTAWQVVVNGRATENMQQPLRNGDEVHIFPPIAGG